jgi:serine protease Do
LICAVLSFAILSPVPAEEPPTDPAQVHVELFKKIRPSIVGIQGAGGEGSGAVISDDGLILTSSLITGNSSSTRVWLPGNRRVKADVVHINQELEIALVKLDKKDATLPALTIGDSSALRIGERVYSVGSTYGSIPNDDQPALSVGVFSGKYELKEAEGRPKYTGPIFETTAQVNPGMDGAPILNASGEIVGIATLAFTKENWSNLFLPVNLAVGDIEEQGVTVRAENTRPGYLGVIVERTSMLSDGVLVETVSFDSPADEAGLEPGDIILTLNGSPVKTPREFYSRFDQLTAGTRIKLTLKKQGRELDVTVTLEEMPY